jgi:pimeloyl-ACP methyl ester carboxylesterase
MDVPETRYAKSGDLRIAYQVVGSGELDLVFIQGFVSNLDLCWEEPGWAYFLSRLASFSRLIVFDKRGTGLSDRTEGVPSLEERMDDLRAVMDAAGSDRAALFGFSEGGPMSLLFAASYPERVRRSGSMEVMCASRTSRVICLGKGSSKTSLSSNVPGVPVRC